MEVERTGDPDQMQAVYLENYPTNCPIAGLKRGSWRRRAQASLYVVNPAARALEENVFVSCGKDGMWWFWWSWAERIAVADDVDQAASTIVRVLASLLPKD